MPDWITNVLAVIGATWLILAVAFGLFLAACWAAAVMDRDEARRQMEAELDEILERGDAA